jgi:hypothetical protein
MSLGESAVRSRSDEKVRRRDPAVPHTAITHLVDPRGNPAHHWPDTAGTSRIAADLRRLTG